MTDTQQSNTPITTYEIDCAVSAKGDVNVSWRVKVQVPSELMADEYSLATMARTTKRMTTDVCEIAAGAKEAYLVMLGAGDDEAE